MKENKIPFCELVNFDFGNFMWFPLFCSLSFCTFKNKINKDKIFSINDIHF